MNNTLKRVLGPTMNRVILGALLLIAAIGGYFTFIDASEQYMIREEAHFMVWFGSVMFLAIGAALVIYDKEGR